MQKWNRAENKHDNNDTMDKRELLKLLLQKERSRSTDAGIGSRPDDLETVPMPYSQEGLWFVNEVNSGKSGYNTLTPVRLTGKLDVEVLSMALNKIVQRHEVLRTVFPEKQGKPEAVILDKLEINPVHTDNAGHSDNEANTFIRRIIREEFDTPFDLKNGPLIRARLISNDIDDHALLITVHHIVFDGWSSGILYQELCSNYEDLLNKAPSRLPDLEVQYSDYSFWQSAPARDAVFDHQLQYWKNKLANISNLEIPADHPRTARINFQGISIERKLPESLTHALRKLSHDHGATIFVILLAAFNALLHRYTGNEDIVVGTPVITRNRPELENLIGMFVNMLVLRTTVSKTESFRNLLSSVRNTVLEAHDNADIPFEKLVQELKPERIAKSNPFFQVLFGMDMAYQSALNTRRELPGITASIMREDSHITRFDMEAYVRDTEDGITLQFVCRDDLYDKSTADRMLNHYVRILESASNDPESPVNLLPLLTDEERTRLLTEWNRTAADYPLEKSLHELIEQQVDRTPDSTAIQFAEDSLSYRELDERANQLARYLRDCGVGTETPVGVFMERSLDMVVALYGIIKSGGAYVPLDPEYPSERLAFVINEIQAPVILSQQHLVTRLTGTGSTIVSMDSEWDLIDGHVPQRLSSGATPDNLAYVIYTSGSTGKPKGVMNTHRGIVNRLCWMQQTYQLDSNEKVLQKTPYSFDVSVWEFFWPLMAGACMVMAKPGGHRDTNYLFGLINSHGITTLHFVPSMLKSFLQNSDMSQLSSLKRVICSGEALTAELQQQFFAASNAELHNLYGPTEAAVDVTSWACQRNAGDDTVPIGRPIANTQLYILDPELQPVPAGVPGELHIGGVQVARGYLNRAELTAEKFIADPFSEDAAARLYKTGDLARYLPDGNIEYLGRIDFQVKLRGFRIELGEIETVLRQHEAVADAIVLCRQDAADEQRLVAYVVVMADQPPTVEQLRSVVRNALPDYMMPSVFVMLDSLPLTSSGKVDRRALPAPKGERQTAQEFVEPRTDLEQTLVDIWKRVLKVDRVGIHDNFFDLGGHSLMATQVVSRMRESLGAELPVTILFEHPTVEGLADRIEVSRWTADNNQEEEMDDWEEFSL